jgi:hypothetical protein
MWKLSKAMWRFVFKSDLHMVKMNLLRNSLRRKVESYKVLKKPNGTTST